MTMFDINDPKVMAALEASCKETQAFLEQIWKIVDASGRSDRVKALARYYADAQTDAEVRREEEIRRSLEDDDEDYDDAWYEAIVAELAPDMTKLEDALADALADAAVRGAEEVLGRKRPEGGARRMQGATPH
jgi:hypothetical protein